MLNVQAMTQTMSAMSLPQLQQYAALHKDDPYTVALALSIANQKKQAMTAQQGQAGMQPMPKVVDQALAQMLPQAPQQMQPPQMPPPQMPPQQAAPRPTPMPEDVGIGQLPAPNIAKMAGGGIVAFGDGGEVDEEKERRERDERAAKELQRIIRENGGKVPASLKAAYAGLDVLSLPGRALMGAANTGIVRPLRAMGADVPFIPERMFMGDSSSMTPAYDELRRAEATYAADQERDRNMQLARAEGANLRPTMANDPRLIGATPPAETVANAQGAPRPPAPPAAPSNRPAPTPGAAPQNAGLQSLITTPEGMKKALADMQKDITPKVPESIASGIRDVTAAEQAAADKVVSDIEAEQKARGPALKEFEARVKEKEGRLSKQEEMQGPLALLQAGFAIMGGTSPFAFANIGAGAQVGLKSYVEGAEKLEAARDKLADSYGKIEEVRRNESRMDAKELRDARQNAMKPAIEAKKLTLSALEKDWGLSRQEAFKGLDAIMANQRTLVEQAEATNRTRMQIQAQKDIAAMPSGEARTAMMLGTGKTDAERLESGMQRLQAITADKSGMAAVKLLTEANAKREAAGQPPLTMDELIRSAREYSALMYPKVADVQNTRARP